MYQVTYGLSCDLKHHELFADKDEAVCFAKKMRDNGYAFSMVYDMEAKGANLVWDHRYGFYEFYNSMSISIDNGKTFFNVEELDVLFELVKNSSDTWLKIVNAMDDEIREMVNAELAPCAEIEFLTRYLELADNDLIIG